MSNYRDDTQETMVIGDALLTGSRGVAEDVMRITAAVVFAMGAMAADALTISDEVIDRRVHLVTELVSVGDAAPGVASAAGAMLDSLVVSDGATGRLRVIHEDVLTISEDVDDGALFLLVDGAVVTDEAVDARHATQLVADQITVKDRAWQPARQLIEDHLSVAADPFGGMRAAVLLVDALSVTDEALDARGAAGGVLVDAVQVADETWGVLAARGTTTDAAVIEDAVVGQGAGAGQIWTAPTGNWAMSRYAPASAEQLAVIDGVVHAVTADGVYALNGDTEVITAEVTTGLLDMGQGNLALLDAAYVEYELSGAAQMTVGQSQTGQLLRWSYTLPPELAGTLTNGRFKFGRGLRGRHFSFTLRLDGKQGYINDWQTLFAKSQRRI